ncbi:hypothetical protein [Clostridium botulinum]|uniref:hypothetical protein n=1 Tax=Clostridium botulinum TaxID=1491 RepID=UPI00016BBA5F|nr:hypothetical protein [Clostridium botulinum]APC80334.1 putative keratin associated protein 5-5 [Clostridium botulinum]APC82393.1 putative keratin associated protein 5-5 [Clostridium botulinum]APH23842.1 putative keratin associated protein 5-5 [Clostridium botulinum]APQ67303.1 putative keratin associated protein 5-5 [Clostridium botulinum]EPS54847.1 keratin associated protein 5-5 [Clostridium botulinum Af84]
MKLDSPIPSEQGVSRACWCTSCVGCTHGCMTDACSNACISNCRGTCTNLSTVSTGK